MKFNSVVITIFFVCIPSFLDAAAVTYELSGGRFGDNLLAYSHAKWLSYKHGVPLYFKPFQYSNELVLHETEMGCKVNAPGNKVLLSKEDMNIDKNRDCLFSVPYFGEVKEEHMRNTHWVCFEVGWQNLVFKQMLIELFSPVNKELQTLELPKDCLTVAVHVRRGGGYDAPMFEDGKAYDQNVGYSDLADPLKFPPLSYYIDQIKKISELSNHLPLYLYFFTDDPQPDVFIEKMRENLSTYDNLTFDWRRSGNVHNKNVLEDFFSLIKFDCLIRPQSNFSIMASKIKDYLIAIAPVKSHVKDKKAYIDEVEINFNDDPLISNKLSKI